MDANAAYWKQGSKVLPWDVHLAAFSRPFELFLNDSAGFTDHRHPFRRQFAEGANGQSRPWERLSLGNVDLELAGEFTNLVFVQFTKRFNHFEGHVFGQAADVVVRFDGVSYTTT